MLHQDDVAGQHRRDGHTCELPDRKIPRHNREDRPKGQIGDIRIDRSCGSGFVRHNLRSVLGVPIRFMRTLLNLGLSFGEDLSHLRRDDLRELCLVFSQGVPELRKELGSFVNRELAKRLKAPIGPCDDFLYLRRCEVREYFDLLTSRRVYSCKSCLVGLNRPAFPARLNGTSGRITNNKGLILLCGSCFHIFSFDNVWGCPRDLGSAVGYFLKSLLRISFRSSPLPLLPPSGSRRPQNRVETASEHDCCPFRRLLPPCVLRQSAPSRAEWFGPSWLRCTSLA